jgi:hypothetical protein
VIQGPFIKPIRSLFGSTRDYRETIYLLPDSGVIQLGRDLMPYPIEASLYWLHARLRMHVAVGPKGMPIETARTTGMMKFATLEMDEHSTTMDIWVMARALCLVLLGGVVEVTEVKADPVSGMMTYPILAWVDEQGRGTCPQCRTRLPWRPAFPVNAMRRCPACHSLMTHREGVLDVLPGNGM